MKFAFSWQALALASAVCAALSAVLGKVGVAQVPPDVATLARAVFMLAFAALFVTASGQAGGLGSIDGRSWTFLGLSSLAGAASWIFYYRAVKIGDVSRVQPIDKMSLVLVALFGVAFLGERLSLANWAGIGLMSAGVILIGFR